MKAIKIAKGKGRNVYRVALVPYRKRVEARYEIQPDRFEVYVEKEHYKLGNYRKAWFVVAKDANRPGYEALDRAAAEKLFAKYEAPAVPAEEAA